MLVFLVTYSGRGTVGRTEKRDHKIKHDRFIKFHS